MTSAFYPTSPIKLTAQEFSEGFPLFSDHGQETDVGETEDEEVKINCMHGVDRDSDLSFADSSDEDRDDDEDEESVADDAVETPGLVHFVSGRVRESEVGIEILRPRAERYYTDKSRLLPHQEEGAETDSASSGSRESVGARGVGISIGTPTSKMSTDGSPSDGDESSISDEDEEDSIFDDEEDDGFESERPPRPINLVQDVSYPSDEDADFSDRDLSNIPELLDGAVDEEFQVQSMEDKVPNLQDEDSETTDGIIFLIPQQETQRDPRNMATQVKRPLSSCSFEALFVDDFDNTSPKRQRSSELPFMPSLSLGPSALVTGMLPMRPNASPISTSDDDEEGDLDQRLSEELDPNTRVPSRENTPVPLLTPPASPLTIQFGEGAIATVCEWPSNLAVDSALTAVSTLRPMSPESLEQLELDEEERVGSLMRHPETSTLTPLLRGIYVGIE